MTDQDWISVKKKMPLPMIRVDVWINRPRWSHRVTDVFTDKHRKAFYQPRNDSSWEKLAYVTHWRKIPEPPKEKL